MYLFPAKFGSDEVNRLNSATNAQESLGNDFKRNAPRPCTVSECIQYIVRYTSSMRMDLMSDTVAFGLHSNASNLFGKLLSTEPVAPAWQLFESQMVRVRKCSNEHCEQNSMPPDAETEYILDDFDFVAPSSAARSWQAVVDEYYSEAGRLYPSSAIRKCSICGDRGTGVMKRRLLTAPPCLALSMEQRIDQFDVSSSSQ